MKGIDEHARVDIHSHLVPGVDDGSRTLDDALESIERMTRAGIRAIVTTPHFNASLLRSPKGWERIEEVAAAFDDLREAVVERFPEVFLDRGFEIMLDDPDPDLSDHALRLAGTSFVLVEWPSMQVPPATEGVLRRIRASGLAPVVAHPERYHTPDRVVPLARMWRNAGAYLQVNHGSLTGRYGARVERRAWELLETGLVDYLATDHHGRPNLELHLDGVVQRLEELEAHEQVQMLARANPRRLLDGLEPLPVPPVQIDRGWKEKLRGFFKTEIS
jgi:protein-tyrosine phosphatase